MSETTKATLEQKLHDAATEYNLIHDSRIELLRQVHELQRREHEVYATWYAMREALTQLGYEGEHKPLLSDDEFGEFGDDDEREQRIASHALRVVSDLVSSRGSPTYPPKWELRRVRGEVTTRGW